jgi:hypothetical protein
LGAYTAAAGSSNNSNTAKDHQSCDSLTDDDDEGQEQGHGTAKAIVVEHKDHAKEPSSYSRISRHVCCHLSDEDSRQNCDQQRKATEFQRLAIVAVPSKKEVVKQQPLRLYEGIVVKVEYQTSLSDEEDAIEDSTLGRKTPKKPRSRSCHCGPSNRNGEAPFNSKKSSSQADSRHSRHIHCYRSAKRATTQDSRYGNSKTSNARNT